MASLLFALGLVLGAAGGVDLDGTEAQVAAEYDDNQALLFAAERIRVLGSSSSSPSWPVSVAHYGGRRVRAGGFPEPPWLGGAASAVLLLATVGFAGIAVHEGVCAQEPSSSDCSGAERSIEPGAFSLLESLDFGFMVLAGIPLGALLIATAIVVGRTQQLPRWLGTAAGVLGVLFPIATIVKFAVLVLYAPFLVWVVAASVVLARPAAAVAKFPARS